MDKDDLGVDQLVASKDFDLFGGTAAELQRRGINTATNGPIPGFVPNDLVVASEDPIGIRLLKKMGWREGQGIGSRTKKKHLVPTQAEQPVGTGKKVYGVAVPDDLRPQIDESEEEGEDIHALKYTFAREDTVELVYKPKNNTRGIGYDPFKGSMDVNFIRKEAHTHQTKVSMGSVYDSASNSGGTGFGIGAFEDADDIDVYGGDNMDLYDKELLDFSSVKKQSKPTANTAAPQLGFKMPAEDPHSSRRCSDGSVPLKKFVLAVHQVSILKWFPPPVVPDNYIPIHKFDTDLPSAPTTRTDTIDANTRATMLGEKDMPITSKSGSVFDFLAPKDREKLANLTGKPIPGAISQPAPIPSIEKQPTTLAPKPTTSAPSKQSTPAPAPTPQQLAIFSMMQSRFTKPDDPTVAILQSSEKGGFQDLAAVKEDSESASSQDVAASHGMFGRLTRSEFVWHPSSLLCKRFNLRLPHAEQSAREQRGDWFDKLTGSILQEPTFVKSEPEQTQEMEPTAPIKELPAEVAPDPTPAIFGIEPKAQPAVVDSEETVVERPPIDLFKAIFEDDEDEGDEDSGAEGEVPISATVEQSTTDKRAQPTPQPLPSESEPLQLPVPILPALPSKPSATPSATLNDANNTNMTEDEGLWVEKPPSFGLGANASEDKKDKHSKEVKKEKTEKKDKKKEKKEKKEKKKEKKRKKEKEKHKHKHKHKDRG